MHDAQPPGSWEIGCGAAYNDFDAAGVLRLFLPARRKADRYSYQKRRIVAAVIADCPMLRLIQTVSLMDPKRRIDKLFLLHIWACVPFAPLWLVYAREMQDPRFLLEMRSIAAVVAVYLAIRTWIVFGGVEIGRWEIVWPIIDVALVTAILIALRSAEDPTAMLYLFAIAYATLKLPGRQAIFVVALAVAGQFLAGWVSGSWDKYLADHNYMYLAFRHLFLLLMASVIWFLSRETQRLRERLALSEYQRELSAEMHDGIQHDLVLMSRRLDLAEALLPQDPARAAAVAVEQGEVARRACDDLRFLVKQLRPGAVTEANFLETLRQHAALLTERYGLPITVECSEKCTDFPVPYQHHVLRVVQEAITNAVKHANAKNIRVAIRKGATRYKVRVEDDGTGFDAGAAGNGGFGLETMRARAEALGGDCRIISRPGTGTRVVVRLPADPSHRRRIFRGTHPRAVGRR